MNYLTKRRLLDAVKGTAVGLVVVVLMALSFMAGMGYQAAVEALRPLDVNITYGPEDLPL